MATPERKLDLSSIFSATTDGRGKVSPPKKLDSSTISRPPDKKINLPERWPTDSNSKKDLVVDNALFAELIKGRKDNPKFLESWAEGCWKFRIWRESAWKEFQDQLNGDHGGFDGCGVS